MKRAAWFAPFASLSIAAAAHAQEIEAPGEHGFAAAVAAGPSYRYFYGLHAVAGEFALDLGGQVGRSAFYGGAGMMVGRTRAGLELLYPHTRFLYEAFVASRWRIGLGVDAGAFAYRRATNGDLEWSIGFGPKLQVSYDCVKSRPATLFAALRTSFDQTWPSDLNAVPQATLLLGGRFR